jgi:hypothetical protein
MAQPKKRTTPAVITEAEAKAALIGDGIGAIPIGAEADPLATQERMAKRVRSTKSMDELFDALSGKSSDEMVNKAFQFNGVAWQAYETERGQIPLAVCEVVDLATGEETEFVTTGGMLVQFLYQAELLNGYPFRARIVEKQTRSGQKALNFERV